MAIFDHFFSKIQEISGKIAKKHQNFTFFISCLNFSKVVFLMLKITFFSQIFIYHC